MKNKTIITISDMNGTKTYSVHKFLKRAFYFTILSLIIVLGGSLAFISESSNKFNEIKTKKENLIQEKEHKIQLLAEKQMTLLTENRLYSMQIEGKVKDIEVLTSKLEFMEEMLGIRDNERKEEITNETLATISDEMKKYTLITIPNGYPLEDTRITSNFGYRIHPITKKRKFHRGTDLKAGRKTEVRTTADGVIGFIHSSKDGSLGRVIKIRHNYGFETVYGHLNKILVKTGDVVRKNQVIALSGNTGRSTAPHLHYEVRQGSRILNPKNFLKWQYSNFSDIMKKERHVKWESIVKLIKEQHNMTKK